MYFKLLELFILRTLFNKDEYKITSKNFNPFRFLIIMILVGNFFFTMFLLYKVSVFYDKVNKECPSVFAQAKKKNKSLESKSEP